MCNLEILQQRGGTGSYNLPPLFPTLSKIEKDVEGKNCNKNSTLKKKKGKYPDEIITVYSTPISKKKKKEKATDINEECVVLILKKNGN